MAKARQVAVKLKTGSGAEYTIRGGQRLDRAALVWRYLAYHRKRFQRTDDARESLTERCIEQLRRLEISEDDLASLASEQLIEVTVPYDDQSASAQVMPWEYLIGEALTDWNASPFIIRHLQMRGGQRRTTVQSKRRNPRSLVVIGARQLLEEHYWFDTELELITGLLPKARQASPKSSAVEHDLTIDELAATIRRVSPDVVHLGGVDTYQGAELLDEEHPGFEGMTFADENGDVDFIRFDELAKVLTQGRTKPSVVAFNLYHSAGRLAASTVANGAGVALAFQDTCEDVAAERFLGQFYRAWKRSNGNPLISAYVAWQSLKLYSDEVLASGLVLWSGQSLIDGDVESAIRTAESIGVEIAETQKPSIPFESRVDARKNLPIVVEPLECLNYALLHNRQPMFDRFEVRNLDEQRTVEDVKVEVELYAGLERLRYSTNLQIGNAPITLVDEVFVPLTSALSRSLRESIRAGMHIQMSVGNHVGIHEQTHRVTLLPIDEWVDDDVNRQWLPSFVFPTDPAIRQIIKAAQGYLVDLTGDSSSGFDGYQAYDNIESGSATEAEEMQDAMEHLDAQVEAIWSALVYAMPLTYINPPPTHTELSQRLRSPSDVLDSGHGTCIDLTLLLATALEYVDIFPVVFLLEGHAFPGYWRSGEDWWDFVNMQFVEDLHNERIMELLSARGEPPIDHLWVFPNRFYAEILDQVKQGKLVPLESVSLTSRSKFDEAQDIGWENLSIPAEFHSLIDIKLARECDVTPLPKAVV